MKLSGNQHRGETRASKSRHDELMSFGAHGQHRTGSGADHTFGNAANEYMSQASPTVRGEYDQINFMLAGVADNFLFRRSLNQSVDHCSAGRPLRIENTG